MRADEQIFGREEAFRFILDELAAFSSINIIGERRMGKTSLLHHLIGNRLKYFISQTSEPSLIIAHIDLQRELTNASRFYGAVLREFFPRLPSGRIARARRLAELGKRLSKSPEVQYNEFEQAIKDIRNPDLVGLRPVIVIDEFEKLIQPSAREGFAYPGFFDGLRSILGDGDELLAMIVASCRPLAEYFSDPERSGSLTSTFPTYFQPFLLKPLDDEAANELLSQKSNNTLSRMEIEEAKRWAKGHPCHLQAAGKAWYQAKAGSYDLKWVGKRREEIKKQSCMVGPSAISNQAHAGHRLRGKALKPLHYLKLVFWNFPLKGGRWVQRLGLKIDDVGAWFIGVALILVMLLLALGAVTGDNIWNWLKER